jgi:glycogen debranching enzyme
MWDEESGTFLAVRRDTLEKVRVATIGSWLPLMAEIPTRQMAGRMAKAFLTEHWQTPLPVPTVDRQDKRWGSSSVCRGDVWPAGNYLVARGFADYGCRQIAAEIADKTVANALKNGISEHYDSMTGKPLGIPDNGATCTVLTLMLDGLSSQHELKVKGS